MKLVINTGRTVAVVARELGIQESTLGGQGLDEGREEEDPPGDFAPRDWWHCELVDIEGRLVGLERLAPDRHHRSDTRDADI